MFTKKIKSAIHKAEVVCLYRGCRSDFCHLDVAVEFSLVLAKSMTVVLLLCSVLHGCGPEKNNTENPSEIAQVVVNRVPGLDYDTFSLGLTPKTGTTFRLPQKSYPASNGRLDVQVPAGNYTLVLALMKNQKTIATSTSCPVSMRIETVKLVPGPNNLDIPVCPPLTGQGTTFSIADGRLLDPTGEAFVIRGVSTPHAYYFDESVAAIPRIKELGFNTVRIVWCADNLIRSGRCESKDLRPLSSLREALSRSKAARLVTVLNLQNATGSDSPDDLDKMVEYLTRSDVKEVLLEYQESLLINVANEWYGTWDRSSNYLAGYQSAVKDLRSAGLPHVLIIDARGYGQDTSSITEQGKDLIALDPNLMISAHLYDVFGRSDRVSNLFSAVRSQKIPFIVGEFGCSHGSGKRVACETIMAEASRPEAQYGYIGWSFSGNSSTLKDLDVVEASDWSTLTTWGQTLVSGTGGVRSTAKEACFFTGGSACGN